MCPKHQTFTLSFIQLSSQLRSVRNPLFVEDLECLGSFAWIEVVGEWCVNTTISLLGSVLEILVTVVLSQSKSWA